MFVKKYPVNLIKIVFQNIPSLAVCKALYRNSAVRDISNKITGATGILLFYTWLKTKQLKIYPNKNNDLCSCFATEVMGKEVIESAKSIVIKKSRNELHEDLNIQQKVTKLEEKQDQMQAQLDQMSSKLDIILMALNK